MVDTANMWVSFDQLWWEVESRADFVKVMIGYLCFLLQGHAPEQTVIVSADIASSYFGATPPVSSRSRTIGLSGTYAARTGGLGYEWAASDGNLPTRPARPCNTGPNSLWDRPLEDDTFT